MSDDLWGELPKADEVIHPKTILNEQAIILAKRTSGLLQGQITSEKSVLVRFDTVLRFSIVCPTLQNYTYGVLSVSYQRTSVYPCEVIAEGNKSTVNDENDFKVTVRNIFQSEPIKKAIAALLREVQDEKVLTGPVG